MKSFNMERPPNEQVFIKVFKKWLLQFLKHHKLKFRSVYVETFTEKGHQLTRKVPKLSAKMRNMHYKMLATTVKFNCFCTKH